MERRFARAELPFRAEPRFHSTFNIQHSTFNIAFLRMNLLITNARVIDPSQELDAKLDLLIEDGLIVRVDKRIKAGTETIDAEGLILVPGLIDLHTHLREPGQEHKETIATAARVPVAMVSLCSCPGSRRCVWRSMRPGTRIRPSASMVSVPALMRLSTRTIRPSSMSRSSLASSSWLGSMTRALVMRRFMRREAMLNVECSMLNVQCNRGFGRAKRLSIQHSTLNIQHSTFAFPHST